MCQLIIILFNTLNGAAYHERDAVLDYDCCCSQVLIRDDKLGMEERSLTLRLAHPPRQNSKVTTAAGYCR